jgi:hypothetical protein
VHLVGFYSIFLIFCVFKQWKITVRNLNGSKNRRNWVQTANRKDRNSFTHRRKWELCRCSNDDGWSLRGVPTRRRKQRAVPVMILDKQMRYLRWTHGAAFVFNCLHVFEYKPRWKTRHGMPRNRGHSEEGKTNGVIKGAKKNKRWQFQIIHDHDLRYDMIWWWNQQTHINV